MTNVAEDDPQKGDIVVWSINQILAYINEDRTDLWRDYTTSDWREGWQAWEQDSGFYSINNIEQFGVQSC